MNSPDIRDIDPWFSKGLLLKASKIHGLGLFTSANIASGKLILTFGGCLLPLSNRRSTDVIPSTAIPLSENIILAECTNAQKDLSDYINHSCNPNIGFRDAISIIAIKNIKKGEELVIDYAFWEVDPSWKLKHDCNCGNKNCRGTISGVDWKQIKSTHIHFNYLSPFLKRRIKIS